MARASRFTLPAAAALIVLTGAAAPAHAGPCCMSATAFGTGRLLPWEDFALGLRTSLSSGLGSWDSEGRWARYEGYDELEWRTELWGLVSVVERLSLFARVPVVVLERSTAAASDVGAGIGDVALGARYEALTIGEHPDLPALALTLALTAPTGRATDEAETTLGVDVTGRGAWVVALGVSAEYTRVPWFVRLDLGVGVPLPAERTDLGLTQRLGPSLDVALAGGVEVAHELVVSLVPRLTWESETVLDGRVVSGSQRIDCGVGLAASWRLAPHWTLQAGLDSGLFVAGLGRNQPGRITTTLGLRFGGF